MYSCCLTVDEMGGVVFRTIHMIHPAKTWLCNWTIVSSSGHHVPWKVRRSAPFPSRMCLFCRIRCRTSETSCEEICSRKCPTLSQSCGTSGTVRKQLRIFGAGIGFTWYHLISSHVPWELQPKDRVDGREMKGRDLVGGQARVMGYAGMAISCGVCLKISEYERLIWKADPKYQQEVSQPHPNLKQKAGRNFAVLGIL